MKMKALILIALFVFGAYTTIMLKAQCEYLEVSEETLELINSLKENEKKYGLTDEDSVEVVQKLSTYREYYKQWENSGFTNNTIDDAIPAWRWCFFNGPLASQYIYINGIKIMEYLYEKTPDEELKEAYIDTLFLIYDQRLLAYGDQEKYGRGFILGQKGGDILIYRSKCYVDAYNYLLESVELEAENSYPHIIYYYYYMSTKMVEAGKADTSIVFDNYETASALITTNLKKYQAEQNAKQIDSWKKYQDKVDNLFGPWASCDDINRIYGPKFAETPNDIDLLKSITKIMDMARCTDEELYFNASDELYKLEPSVESAINLGKMYFKRKMYNKSIEYLTIGVDSTEDAMEKADLYLLLAHAYRGASNFSTARTMANNCLELDPTRGEAYILIGDLYYSSSTSCGGNDVEKKFGYMAAADKYYKAKTVSTDEKVQQLASQKAASVSSNFPENADVFFYGYTKGQSVNVGCWIQETTTIRTID